ncbi:MAG: bifunctional D-glycero-beta-D-manno-heptose-7-phosphate kinase/D-glycero-beta-D-manno-heptose 1-phosphate adenylyltransferase HldE [Gammaproteobacteria bacterium]|nr:bifunctional D-glycero-beta-D-manno-heptose-7-phosphate kinase/D-glycero-beta-D-manno-heptose 1-phosphate adenylyltransferase HldE [Gammaproteobacteria bacterium]
MSLAIPDFSTVRALVAGDVMLDQYWFGPTSRISPEAPVPVVKVTQSQARPGGAANVAVNLASLGVRTTLAGVVGQDAGGGLLRQALGERGIALDFVESGARPTITKLRVLSRNQQLIRLDTEDAFGPEESRLLLERVRRGAAAASVCILSDYGKGSLLEMTALVDVARAARLPVLVDPKGTDFARYRGATLLTPNLAEFEAVAGTASSDADLAARARRMRGDLGLEALVVTLGERGMMVVTGAAEAVFMPARAREVFDVTGAGDTVIAALAAGLGAGMTLTDAAALANVAAGIVVRKIGVASATPMELRQELHEHGLGGRGIVAREDIARTIGEARARGERLVMTNGVFDILHAGHVGYLEEAKARGDRLLVAVNDDESVRRLKGPERPVNPLADRMAVLAALAAVDWVVPFSEDTPAALIGEVLPDVLVKGGDYRPEDIAGGPAVIAHGGRVEVLPFREGRSTTRILEAIRKRR